MNLPKFLEIRLAILYTLVFLCISFAFSLLIIKDFSHPLAGGGDIEYWEYTGFYFARNLNFLPFPHLDLVNNQAFYPYGTNAVFQPWSIERDILYAAVRSVFGIGPWLQFYYLFSVLSTAIGTFALLVKDYRFIRASSAGLLISFFNFYTIHKYPDHLSYAVVHWTALSFVADFLIVKKVVLKQNVSLRLLLIRTCLLVLSLGQELGYIAGFALMSLAISTLFIVGLIIYRYLKREYQLLKLSQKIVREYKNEFLTHPRTCLTLLASILLIGYINLPLVIQISREAKSFDFTGVPSGAWWASPLRLLIPFLPSFNPGQDVFEQILKDSPEGLGAGSPGWFLLIIGTLGLWQTRKQFLIFVPLLLIFLLCIFYNPLYFPILKIFPWFTFNRVQGRCTVIYAVILCIFALNIDFSGWRSHNRQLISALLVFLACTELYTAYSFKLSYQPYSFDKNFFSYMDYVKKQPGEAVLDWPFCLIGGNAVGLCPYFSKTGSIFALRRFHEKKVMGQYFGRLHPSQVEPYLESGWDKLFFPDTPDVLKATHQVRCFRPEEWSFFTDFYKLNDFAGINLYVDLLPENCVKEFYSRFGNSTVETTVPWAGQVKFIPKPSELKNQVDLKLGASLKFQPTLDLSESNLIQLIEPYGLGFDGLNIVDKDASENPLGRWAFGPETRLNFNLAKPQFLELTIEFVTPISNQDIVIKINKTQSNKISNIKPGETVTYHLRFKGVMGSNVITFNYKDWNQNKTKFAPDDTRHFAVYFTKLAIRNSE